MLNKADKYWAFQKIYGKCAKTLIYQPNNNWSKRTLFGIRNKISYNKIFSEDLTTEVWKNSDTHE